MRKGHETQAGSGRPGKLTASDGEPPLPFIVYRNGLRRPQSNGNLRLTLFCTEDPHEAAVAFGGEHGLSENYVAQIEAFVRSHVK